MLCWFRVLYRRKLRVGCEWVRRADLCRECLQKPRRALSQENSFEELAERERERETGMPGNIAPPVHLRGWVSIIRNNILPVENGLFGGLHFHHFFCVLSVMWHTTSRDARGAVFSTCLINNSYSVKDCSQWVSDVRNLFMSFGNCALKFWTGVVGYLTICRLFTNR